MSRTRWTGQKGQTMVELALITPMLLLISMAAAAATQMLGESVVLRTAAREGAIAAAAYYSSPSPLPAGCYAGGASITSAQACAQYRVTAAGAPASVTVAVSKITGATSGISMSQVVVTDIVHPGFDFFGSKTLTYTSVAAVPQ